MLDRPISLVREVPEVLVEDGLVFIIRPDGIRAQSPHIAEATSRKVLAALAEWRARENVVPFDKTG